MTIKRPLVPVAPVTRIMCLAASGRWELAAWREHQRVDERFSSQSMTALGSSVSVDPRSVFVAEGCGDLDGP